MKHVLNKPVSELKGIGPAREKMLAGEGIRTWKDLFLCLPRRFKERPEPGTIAALDEGKVCAAKGVVKRARVSGWGRRKNLRVLVEGDGHTVELLLFNRGYLKSSMKPGRLIAFQGKVTRNEGKSQMLSPDYHLEGDPGQGFPGLVPVYSLPSGLYPRTFHRMIDGILDEAKNEKVPDWREVSGLPGRGLIDLHKALNLAHRPSSLQEADKARRRIAYEEFFAFQLGLAVKDAEREAAHGEPASVGCALPLQKIDEAYGKCLPFDLTRAQIGAVKVIKRDLEKHAPMHRLLQGDVGSGKTVVALYPLLAAALGGGQAALMAPTEVLAKQHHGALSRLLRPVGIEPVFLRAGLSGKEARRLLHAPSTGIVVGTHALIQERIGFRSLSACVIDEQHKFGVRQRRNLKSKGVEPDVLVMTATPIPRSLALTLYGELDITTLDELPPGRIPVETRAVQTLYDPEVLSRLDQEIISNGRVFFVCPLIHESEKMDLEAAVELHKKLEQRFKGRCNVALLHGAMPSPNKALALDRFRAGCDPFLVTTVVVEVGVDVPDASTVVILDAWRFGLAQLHQIRGRVGRGSRPSMCFLVGTPSTRAGSERLRVITESSNGFHIAEEDLKMRGPGEILGLRQHGLTSLKAGDIIADLDLMVAARDDARVMVSSGAALREGQCLFPADTGEGKWIG